MSNHGEVDKAKGRLKQAGGDLTGNDRLKAEGEVDEGRGTIKDKIQKVTDQLKKRV